MYESNDHEARYVAVNRAFTRLAPECLVEYVAQLPVLV